MPQHRLQATTIASVGRTYSQGVSRVTGPRPYVKYLRVQNRDNQSMYFWFGRLPVDPSDPSLGVLPDDPADWDTAQTSSAESTIQTFGMEIVSGDSAELGTATTTQLYSYVPTGSAVAHLLIG